MAPLVESYHGSVLKQRGVLCAADAHACKAVSAPPPSLGGLLRSRSSVEMAHRAIMSLIMTCMGLYIFFNLGLMVSKNFIIEGYISRWRMEMRGFDMGPPPVWLDDPPEDFGYLPPEADKYVNFSLSLNIVNNPQWLRVEISRVEIHPFKEPRYMVTLRAGSGTAVDRDGTISISVRVPLAEVNEAAYFCLRHAPARLHQLPFTIDFEAKLTLFSHRSKTFLLRTRVGYDLLEMINNRNERHSHSLEEIIARKCHWVYDSGEELPIMRPHYGEVVVMATNHESLEYAVSLPEPFSEGS
ncbi:hypothetical protein FOZ62_030406 [Perkinsus olseni]|uniref:Uncharacterized protein n=1 Tax=Perkinsus olseni TaxID=32597 RepID=A0A7J6NRE5_PEROL|nr:hypothetical protein FOZ62_030406 [Perkinsus olseni]